MARIKERSAYCFKASLKYIHNDETFEVPFEVIADDRYKAKTMLEEWLKTPSQTGYKYECCVGIIPDASKMVLIEDEQERNEVVSL